MFYPYLTDEEKNVMDNLLETYKIDTIHDIFTQAKIYQYIFHDFHKKYETYFYLLQKQNPSFLRKMHQKMEMMNQKINELQYEMDELSFLFQYPSIYQNQET